MFLFPETHAKRVAPRRFSTQAGRYGFFLLAALYGSSAIAQPPPGQVFYDVTESSPYFNATTTMYQLGLSVGCDTSHDFCPNNDLTRQDMAVFIVTAWSARMWNDPIAFEHTDPPSTTPYFSDVSSSSPQFPYIQKLYELGITAGTHPGIFSPLATLTNDQIAVFVTVAGALAANGCTVPYITTTPPPPFPVNNSPGNAKCAPGYFGSGPSQNPYFSDVVSGTYFKFVQQLGDSGAVAPPSVPSGYPGCTTCVFGGNNAITRGQMAIWTVVGMGLDPRSVLSMNAVGYGGGPNYYSTLPTVTAAFTYTLHDQEYGENDIQGAQFILADSSGAYHCVGYWAYWAGPTYVLDLNEQTYGYNIPQSDAFCTVSLVSYTPSPTDPTAVTVVLNFTFSPGFTGAYTVISQVNYYSGYSAPLENVGTLTLQAPPTYNPAPTVTLTDTTQSSGYYYVGDNFTVTVAGPANVAGLPVSLTQNGIYYGQCGICGTTNSSGVYQLSGTWTAAEVGSYTQTWYVDGVAATPGLSFQVLGGQLPLTSSMVPQPPPTPAPAPVAFPAVSGSTTNCWDISGTWVDTPSPNSTISWSLFQTGTAVSGTLTETTDIVNTWSVSGQSVGGVATLTASAPSPAFDPDGNINASSISVVMTVTGCLAGTAQETDTYPAYSNGFQNFPQYTAPTRTTYWAGSSAPGLFMSVDMMNGLVSLVLTAQNKSGPLSVAFTAPANNPATTTIAYVSNATPSSPPPYKGWRTSLSPGQYTSVVATWDDISLTVPVSFYVLGNTRFSQYNTPYESQCPASPQPAQIIYKMDSQYCYYQGIQMGSQFMSQVFINGTGVNRSGAVLKSYNAGAATVCPLNPGFNSGNTFFSVDAGGTPITKITGTNNTTISDGTGAASPPNNNNPPAGSVAVFPVSSSVHQPAPPFTFGDQILLVGQNDVNDPIGPRSVQDLCPACGTGSFGPPSWGNTVAHIDMYTSNQACSKYTPIPDYGNNTAIRLG